MILSSSYLFNAIFVSKLEEPPPAPLTAICEDTIAVPSLASLACHTPTPRGVASRQMICMFSDESTATRANPDFVTLFETFVSGMRTTPILSSFAKYTSPVVKLLLSQTTQIPARFTEFVKKVIDSVFTKDSELRIIDTICHDIRERQQAALELASKVDLMFVIGSPTSANTNHLADLCKTATETYFIETAEDIQPSWLEGHHHIGVTGGASTAEETINDVVARLEAMDDER